MAQGCPSCGLRFPRVRAVKRAAGVAAQTSGYGWLGVDEFFGLLNPPVVVATTTDGQARAGCVVGFTTQCSIEPLRLLVCLSRLNHTYRVASQARCMAVHLLGKGDHRTAALFAEESGDEVDKLAQTRWRRGVTGAPVLETCRAWMECWIERRVALGDHVGYVLAPAGGGSAPPRATLDGAVLRLDDVRDLQAGHPPRRAPGPPPGL
jgi:flavin reductase (DIM6/NTAB) family NADH-FMN oxidoreductase RutF